MASCRFMAFTMHNTEQLSNSACIFRGLVPMECRSRPPPLRFIECLGLLLFLLCQLILLQIRLLKRLILFSRKHNSIPWDTIACRRMIRPIWIAICWRSLNFPSYAKREACARSRGNLRRCSIIRSPHRFSVSRSFTLPPVSISSRSCGSAILPPPSSL